MTIFCECSTCKAQADCMASVLARGPLLNGCEEPPERQRGKPQKSPILVRRDALQTFIEEHGTFTQKEAEEATGYSENGLRKRLTNLVDCGMLRREVVMRGGLRSYVYTSASATVKSRRNETV